MGVEVIAASESDFTIVKNLVPYYIYDMSEYMGWDCNAEGRYDGCDDLPDYWQKDSHHPYLIRMNGKLAGFALVRPYPDEPDITEIGEFFVLRKFKRQGVGKQAATHLFDSHPGKWLIRVLNGNQGALKFWETVIGEYTSGSYTQTSRTYECPHSGRWPMQYFRFDS